MTPGPTLVKKCSECMQLVTQQTILSGNTIGSRFWTDGKRHFPMLPDFPQLVECPHCQAFVWIEELEQVGDMDSWESRRKFKKAADRGQTAFH